MGLFIWAGPCSLGRRLRAVFRTRGGWVKLVLFSGAAGVEMRPGLWTDRGIIDISAHVPQAHSAQARMEALITGFEGLRPVLEKLEAEGEAIGHEQVRLGPPLPRPGKIVNCIGNYWEHAQRAPADLNMFLKNPDAVVGPGDVIRLPAFEDPWCFISSWPVNGLPGPMTSSTQPPRSRSTAGRAMP